MFGIDNLRQSMIGLTFAIQLLVAVACDQIRAQEPPNAIEQRLRADLDFLADDAREGRGIGTQGLIDAGAMIAQRFEELGLDTKLFADSPFQDFTITDGYEAAVPTDSDQPAKNWLQITGQTQIDPVMGVEWMPLSLGSNGAFSGELVFAGYGITAADLGYDDYAGLDVKDKVVIVIRKQPGQNQQDGKFGAVQNSNYAYFSTKETNAAMRGVAAMILVNDHVTAESEAGDRLFSVSDGGRSVGPQSVPTLHVLRETIDPIIQLATGKTLRELEDAIDQTQEPASQPLGELIASGATEIQRKETPVRNVVGLLPGVGQLADQFIVVGAHYDHVGMGGPGSLAPGTIEVHNGADDNASGTVALLEIARQMTFDTSEDRRSILFIAFTAEERGLLGSKHYVKYPLIPIEKTIAMINLDMVGRLHDNALTVYGTGTAVEFPAWLEELSQPLGLELNQQAAGYGPSDHQSFHEVGLPVLHLFSGMHSQYHRPSDDIHLIDFQGLSQITHLAAGLTFRLASHPVPPIRLRNEARARIGAATARQRAVLGVSLDGDAEQCIVSMVNEDSAAMKAGIQPDDIIVRIDDKAIESTDDLIQSMRRYRVGDEVTVRVVRDGEELEVKAQLQAQ